jgi:hypothetical protein
MCLQYNKQFLSIQFIVIADNFLAFIFVSLLIASQGTGEREKSPCSHFQNGENFVIFISTKPATCILAGSLSCSADSIYKNLCPNKQ